MSAPRPLWDCFQANRRSVLDIPLNEYSVAIWIYHNGPDRVAWAVPQTGTTCEFCGKEWTVLAAEFVAHRSAQSGQSSEPPLFLHRCRIAHATEQMHNPGDEAPECSLNRLEEAWEVACAKAHPRHAGPDFNGRHCSECDYTLQACRFHRWASNTEVSRCRSCLRNSRISKVIKLAIKLPGIGNVPAKVSASLAFDGVLLSELAVASPEEDMGSAFRLLASVFGDSVAVWLQFLHDRVLCDIHGAARIVSDGTLARSGDRPDLTVGSRLYPDYPFPWAVAGLRTFRLQFVVEIQGKSFSFPQEHLRTAAQFIGAHMAEAVASGDRALACRIIGNCLSYADNSAL